MSVRRRSCVVFAVIIGVGIGGASSAAALTATTRGTTVVLPSAATPGLVNAITTVNSHTQAPPIEVAP